jgi:hypothetical protein
VTQRNICLICVALCLNLAGQKCQGKRVYDKPGFDYSTDVGIAVTKPDDSCLEIRNPNLRVGQRLTFVVMSGPQSSGEIEITEKLDRACGDGAQNQAQNRQMHGRTAMAHYEFKTVRGTLPKLIPVIALANFNGDMTARPEGVGADLDHDGRPEFFRSCISPEGVHITIWTGKPLEGTRRWHGYYALSYDVDADCTEADTRQ